MSQIVRDLIENEVSDFTIITLYKNLEDLRNKSDYYLGESITAEDFHNAIQIKDHLLLMLEDKTLYLGGIDSDLEEYTRFKAKKRSK